MAGKYIVKVDGVIKLETPSKDKAEKLYESFIGKTGKVTKGEIEMIYPPFEEKD